MGHAFQIKRGDAFPVLSGVALKRATGDPLTDLASAPYPRFILRASGQATPLISATAGATITDTVALGLTGAGGSQARLAFSFAPTPMATPGAYQGEFELTYPGGRRTVPGVGYLPVVVLGDLG